MTTQSGRIVRQTTSGNTLPEAGRIKIGATVPGKTSAGKDYNRPVSLDYFRATGQYAEMFNKAFGKEPKKLTVVFISDDVNEVCNQRFECWDNGKRWGWGDGENFTIYSEKDKKYIEVKKESPLLIGRKWDEMLTLRFILPDLKGLLGQWSFTTKGSKSIIPSLIKGFDFIKDRVGTVSGIPWEFHVEKVKGYSPGEAHQYSRVKLIPVITSDTVEKVRDYLEAGKSISSIAPIMLNEAKLEGNKRLEAPEIIIEAPTNKTEVKDGGLF